MCKAKKLCWHHIVVVVQHFLKNTHTLFFAVDLLIDAHILGLERRQNGHKHTLVKAKKEKQIASCFY